MAGDLRDRIIAGGAEAFRDSGLRGFSMEQAALKAGVSRKTVYNYFSSRFELLDGIVEARVRETLAVLGAIAADASLGFVEKLNRITEEGFRRGIEGTRFLKGEGSGAYPRSAEPYRVLRKSLADFITGIVSEAAGLGLIRGDVDPRRLTYVILNMVAGLLDLDGPDDDPYSRIEILKESLRLLIGGILSPAGVETLRGYSLLERGEASE